MQSVSLDYAEKHCRIDVSVSPENQIDIHGCWPNRGAKKSMLIAVNNPYQLLRQLIQENLIRYHIQFSGKIISHAFSIPNTKPFWVHRSPPLKILIKEMLKNSNNLYARLIGKALGEKEYHQATIQEGANATIQILHDQFNIDFDTARILDVAGASLTLLSPKQIVETLRGIKQTSFGSIFMNALSISGKIQDGTLKHIWTLSHNLPDGIKAKTGSATGTSSLSGYMHTEKGNDLVFSILVNNIPGHIKKARRFQAAICQYLSKYY